jgi:hypothetical protein
LRIHRLRRNVHGHRLDVHGRHRHSDQKVHVRARVRGRTRGQRAQREGGDDERLGDGRAGSCELLDGIFPSWTRAHELHVNGMDCARNFGALNGARLDRCLPRLMDCCRGV